ncbi:MAG: GDSL-type esterase/lipase family protein [Verrucomicrobiota bacterium]
MSVMLSAATSPLPKKVGATNDQIHKIGRFTDNGQFAWSSSTIRTVFSGSSLQVELEGKKAFFDVVLDGKWSHMFEVTPEQSIYQVLEGKHRQHCRVEIIKRTEAHYSGSITFAGFRLSQDGSLSQPPRRERKILAIGDSITCGYGAETAVNKSAFNLKEENSRKAYPHRLAEALDADYHAVSWSGRGMFRNRKDDGRPTLPILFNWTLPDQKTNWVFDQWVPDLILINLGTNDRSLAGGRAPIEKRDFVGAYRDFLKRLRTLYPNAKLIVLNGPMTLLSEQFAFMGKWIEELADEMGESVVFMSLPPKRGDGWWGAYHPSERLHADLAERLQPKIQAEMGW